MTATAGGDPFQDTIAAIATPPGEGGIGIVRLSGPRALEVAARVFSPSSGADPQQFATHTIHHGHVVDPDSGAAVDEVLLLLMRAPTSYTGEDVVELHGHGGRICLQAILHLVLRHGTRPALPGEFTRRAFLNGRLDLAQAEAVLGVVRAKTEAGLKAALRQLQGGLSERVRALRAELISLLATLEASVDFPEEGLDLPEVGELEKRIYRIEDGLRALIRKAREGRLLQEGAAVIIAGRPNVGKSSLLNALLGRGRAIVSTLPGTTRDTVEEEIQIGGIPVRLIDTAGLRQEEGDPVGAEGLRRTRTAMQRADLIIVVFDGSEGITPLDLQVWSETRGPRVLVVNKSDLPSALSRVAYQGRFGVEPLFTSALTGQGVEAVRLQLQQLLRGEAEGEVLVMVGPRHREALERAEGHLLSARRALGEGVSLELVALDVRAGLNALGEVLGETVTEEVLDQIFRDFCIGK
ncbi:MAG: tRNA uridine-5-carboxymethylaminomethyl(34) synthesis GTPase MnmE [Candidatus Methylomirabilales bacterium]